MAYLVEYAAQLEDRENNELLHGPLLRFIADHAHVKKCEITDCDGLRFVFENCKWHVEVY